MWAETSRSFKSVPSGKPKPKPVAPKPKPVAPKPAKPKGKMVAPAGAGTTRPKSYFPVQGGSTVEFKSGPAPKRPAGTPTYPGKPRKSLKSASKDTRAKAEALRMKKQDEKFTPKTPFEEAFGINAADLFKKRKP